MRLAAAQIRPIIGPIESNIQRHEALVELATRHGADLIIFPELSLTGYEPSLATKFSRSCDDSCLSRFQTMCDARDISVGVGFPLHTRGLPQISTLIFRPHVQALLYSKQYLHPDEEPFFSCGPDADSTIHNAPTVAIAICYELSIPEHAQRAFERGATVYMASAAKTAAGVKEASQRLSSLAKQHAAIVILSNCIGEFAEMHCSGSSSAWGRDGELLARLDSSSEGVIVVDDLSEEVVTDVLPSLR